MTQPNPSLAVTDATPPRLRVIAALVPYLHALLRIGAGLLFMQHGAQKLFGAFGGFGAPGQHAALASQFGLAGVLEFFGGLLIVVGFLTRPVAFLLAGEMFVAYLQAHAPHGFWPIENHGELPLLFCLVWLTLLARGAGSLSIDAALRKR